MKKNIQTEFSTRQYMINNDFEIYYYNDQGLKRVAPHTHDYYEFYFFQEGDVAIEINQMIYALKPGDVVLIPPGISHHAIVNNPGTPYRRFVFWISHSYMDFILKESSDYGYMLDLVKNGEYIFPNDQPEANTLYAMILTLIEEVNCLYFGRDEKIKLCIQSLLLHLNRTIYNKRTLHTNIAENNLYRNLITYISEHFDEDLTLDRLSAHFYVSKFHISHVFKENTGLSLHQYLIKKRLSACKTALLKEEAITSFYQMYGFKDYSSFYRAFKKEYGLSPKDWKDQQYNLTKQDANRQDSTL